MLGAQCLFRTRLHPPHGPPLTDVTDRALRASRAQAEKLARWKACAAGRGLIQHYRLRHCAAPRASAAAAGQAARGGMEQFMMTCLSCRLRDGHENLAESMPTYRAGDKESVRTSRSWSPDALAPSPRYFP